MPNVKKILAHGLTGKTVYSVIQRDADGAFLQAASGTFAADANNPVSSASCNPLAESAVKGFYALSESRTAWNGGLYIVTIYQQAGGSPAPAADTVIGGGRMYIVSDLEVLLDGSVAGNATALATLAAADFNAAQKTSLNAATPAGITGNVAGSVASVTAPVTVGANNDKGGYVLATPPPTAVQVRQEMDANSTRLAALATAVGDLPAPDNASIAATLALLQDATVGLARLDAELDGLTAALGNVGSADIQTLLSRLTDARAALLDNLSRLDISVSSAQPVIPVVSGGSSTVVLTERKQLQLRRGDSYRLSFSLGRDCTDWTARFGARFRDASGAYLPDYSIPIRACTWTDAAAGTGYVDLTAADTATTGLHYAEVELNNGAGGVSTPQEYVIGIVDDVIK